MQQIKPFAQDQGHRLIFATGATQAKPLPTTALTVTKFGRYVPLPGLLNVIFPHDIAAGSNSGKAVRRPRQRAVVGSGTRRPPQSMEQTLHALSVFSRNNLGRIDADNTNSGVEVVERMGDESLIPVR
jgi:hypothetical protein